MCIRDRSVARHVANPRARENRPQQHLNILLTNLGMGHRVLQDALHRVALRALQRRRHVAIAAAWSVRAGVEAIAFRDEVVRARTDAKRAGGILPLRTEWHERRWLVT